MTLVSMPGPLMSLPMRSTTRTSISRKGMRGISSRARRRSSDSASPPTSAALRPRASAVSSRWFSTTASAPKSSPLRSARRAAAGMRSARPAALAACMTCAPGCLPKPIAHILAGPDSTGPRKLVCGLTREIRKTAPASTARLSACQGTPGSASPTTTVSMVARTGAPTRSSVTPKPARTSACPAAVAAPWLPMAGTMKGSQPAALSAPTLARTTSSRLAIPRLPTPTATGPGVRPPAARTRPTSSHTAASMPSRRGA